MRTDYTTGTPWLAFTKNGSFYDIDQGAARTDTINSIM